ncbi:hypothetical protein GTP41_19935 [Pseudoduganella sp. DS3]|uniref:Uncharacterized protein n=1 Tax=Pseudoduganella guangdongensis TaxID=2692179 RepID=A0A6N9HL41_9BURK|nr:hypothetical protein [Pseudoduganella guangdongensis]MYN04368.1 hypothetical protein [Pseudoduganella guangdongensis]
MQPNLFVGPVQRDDSYRILARLAHGGNVPARAGGWSLGATLKSRLAVAAGLLSLGALAWLWLQSPQAPQPSAEQAAPAIPQGAVAVAAPRKLVEASEPQAATIVSQANAPEAPMAKAPAISTAAASAAPAGKAVIAAREPAKQARRPAQQAAPLARSAAPVESDEDVTLLAAMLKHAKPHKPAVSPPPKN